jgi:deazaflavin-dependent oxidoreductase (nitroreductase family)
MRFVNPVVVALLRSRLHGMVSKQVLLLTYTGRRSGRPVTLPVGYTSDGGTLLVICQHAGQKRWWRNLRGGAPVTLHLRGRTVAAHTDVIEEALDVAAEVERLVGRLGAKQAGARLYLDLREVHPLTRERLGQSLARVVLIRITLDEQHNAFREESTWKPVAPSPTPQARLSVPELVGSGDRIGQFALPFVLGGLNLNGRFRSRFAVGGPPATLRTLSLLVLTPGVALWAWSVALILTRVRRDELVTTGPYALVKHPLYTSVSILVLPWAGFLCNTWLGAVFGLVLYAGSRRYAPAEEAQLSSTFGGAWQAYCARVRIPWL